MDPRREKLAPQRKHYGVLQGLNKSETAARFGEEQVHIWRRSYDVAPDPLAEDDPRNPRFDPRYAGIPDEELPRTESLKQTIERALPYWQCVISPNCPFTTQSWW